MRKELLVVLVIMLFSCSENKEGRKPIKQVTVEDNITDMQKKLSKYVSFKLSTNVSLLSENEKKMLPILIKAASYMNDLFWFEDELLCEWLGIDFSEYENR
jgi:hypothetical protein